MDKGFNDDELADIMNEIESLEKEFEEETQPEPVVAQEAVTSEEVEVEEVTAEVEQVTAEVEEVTAEVEQVTAEVEQVTAEVEEVTAEEHHEEEEVLEELSEIPVEEVVAKHEAFEENVHSISQVTPAALPAANTAGHSSMSFTVEGDMKLDLAFNISGKIVKLNISENGFELELDGGMKFSIPIENSVQHKKSA